LEEMDYYDEEYDVIHLGENFKVFVTLRQNHDDYEHTLLGTDNVLII